MVRLSRDGEETRLPVPSVPTTIVRWSPDGRRLVLRIDGANGQLWIYDIARETLSRITHEWDADFPAWSPESDSVLYVLTEGGKAIIAERSVDGTGEPTLYWSGNNINYPHWAPDRNSIVYSDETDETGRDLWVLHLGDEPRAVPYLQTPAEESDGVVSPDGRWLAYVSDESGRREVYVQAYPVPGRRVQISARGGGRSRLDVGRFASSSSRRTASSWRWRSASEPTSALRCRSGSSISRTSPGATTTTASTGSPPTVATSSPRDALPTGSRPSRLQVVVNWVSTLPSGAVD